MNILIDVQHPAHVHFFRNTARNLERDGHKVKITGKDKEVTLGLLDKYGFTYEVLGRSKKGLTNKFIEMLKIDCRLLKLVKTFKPDIMMGIHHESIAQISFITRQPSIIFTDTEDVKLGNILTFPFTTTICTPTCFLNDLGNKHVRYNGYHELAYLHPNYFRPDPSVLDDLDLSKDDKFIVLRFISWGASHDIGLGGIKKGSELNFIKKLEPYGRIFITSEKKLDPELERYRITAAPEKIHSLLYYAQLYTGEGGTMAVESAILGTPAIHIESNSSGIATGNLSGNFLELRDRYDLLHFYPDQEQALEKAIEILENKNSKKEWQKKKEKLIADKIDVTAWMTDFIERYPTSFYDYLNKNE